MAKFILVLTIFFPSLLFAITPQSFCQSQAVVKSWPLPLAQPTLATDLINLNGVSRDRRVVEEIEDGMGPGAEGLLSPVVVTSGQNEIVFCVFNDYLALFQNDELARFPLGMTVLDDFIANSAWTLPTAKMVDYIYRQSSIKLSPQPIPASPQMTWTSTILKHSEMINERLGEEVGLVAGHKKDVVISNRLANRPSKIAIYGWHRTNGNPIQPLSTVHHKDYADYSHGIRFVYKTALFNGTTRTLGDILSGQASASLLSNEGVLNRRLIEKYY